MITRAAAKEVTLLDYGAGNVRSVRNAITKLGYTIKDVSVGCRLHGGQSMHAIFFRPVHHGACALHAL